MTEQIECRLRRFNPRRVMRGAPAAEVEIDGVVLWMTRDDIAQNVTRYGLLPGLKDAAEHYRTLRPFPARN
jgi:hypothetical protein